MTPNSSFGTVLIPHPDIRPEEGCFVCHDNDGNILGYVQIFKDGSAGYWLNRGEQAKQTFGTTGISASEVACAILRRHRQDGGTDG